MEPLNNFDILFGEKTEKNYLLRPSAAKRWMNCTASVGLINSLPPEERNQSSSYADEGTRAHALAYSLLMDEPFEGDSDEEMRGYVGEYVEYVNTVQARNVHSRALIEKKLEYSSYLGGTADCIVYSSETNELHIVDLKYGAGVFVKAENNEQLLIYALMALLYFENEEKANQIQSITTHIFQPRYRNPIDDSPSREWRISRETILEFKKAVDETIQSILTNNVRYACRPEVCAFCPLLNSSTVLCPALTKQLKATAHSDFFEAKADLPEIETLSFEQLSFIQRNADLLKQFLKGAEERIKQILLTQGENAVPGFKTVVSLGNREWIDENQVIEMFKDRVTEEQLYEKKLFGPAKLEKIVGKKVIQSLVKREERGHRVVPIENEIGVTTAQLDFGANK